MNKKKKENKLNVLSPLSPGTMGREVGYTPETEISLKPVGFFFPEEILHENSQQDNEVQRD